MKITKNKKHFAWKALTGFAITLMTMVALSCSDELVEPNNNKNLAQDSEFFIIDNTTSATRVAYDNYNHSTFNDGDLVGVYLLEGKGLKSVEGETFENVPYKVTNTKNILTDITQQVLRAATENKIPQADGYTYVFVYPYTEGQTYNDLVKLTHTTEAEQSSAEKFEQSDLLWDVEIASNNTVHIAMHHAMAQIIVEVDENKIAEDATVRLTSNLKTKVQNLNLSTVDGAYSSVTANDLSEAKEISMWDFGYSESGNCLFRAVVPAQSNISKEKFLTFKKKDGTDKTYNLQEDLTVEAGKNYIFAIRKNSINPDINDDDSWVLDVVDPETGEPVGLLCREYVRYQPSNIDNNNTYAFDVNTGTDNGSGSKWINSQAWVFYNLQDFNTRIPDLNKGTVLRFIYDFEKPGYVWWPYSEGHNYVQHGIFSPVHGATWCSPFNNYENSAEGGHEVYDENNNPKITEYYMHGGTITWDGVNNKISNFTMPTELITCEQAEKYGHIAINGKDIYVSYKENDGDGIKRGVLIPHCLIDQRISQTGVLEINKYPLVKIGYNQFWMSKSLNAKTMTDGTPIACYNKKGSAGVTFDNTTTDDMTAGYIYPYITNVEDGTNGNKDYDPFNNKEQMAGYGSFKPLPLYNSLCLMNEKFLPKATDSRLNYIIPAKEQIEDMKKYFGIFFGAKMMSRYVTPKTNKDNDMSFAYSSFQSVIRGESRGGQIGSLKNQDPANAYTANVSGYNCRALGYYSPDNSITDITGTSFIQLKPNNRLHVSHFIFHVYDAWKDTESIIDEQRNQYRLPASKHFGQVRFVMKFKNQADTGGSSRAATRAEATSSVAPQSSNNVYIQLKEE